MHGQIVVSSGRFISVGHALGHGCALRESGTAACWGSDEWVHVNPPPGYFSAISVGPRLSCALRSSGELECQNHSWNEYDGTYPSPGRFAAVSVGDSHGCGLRESGELACWRHYWPAYEEPDPPPGRFRAVSAGGEHTCALRESNELECWGGNEHGQATAPEGRFRAVSAGWRHTCGILESDEVECWGSDEYGQSGAPTGRFSAISAGDQHTCGLRETGEIVCWGDNENGQAEAPTGRFTAVSAGSSTTCGLTEAGGVRCWGSWAIRLPPAVLAGGAQEPPVTPPLSWGRIAARRLADGRVELGWQPAAAEERVLPAQRHFPTNAQAERWLRSSPIELGGVVTGRINARLLADGRIEFAFTPADGERILPASRFFPADAAVGRWLRSTEIELSR